MASDDSICFSCGQGAGDPPVLNRLESGEVCKVCGDRFLDALPPLLPGTPELEEADEIESWQLGPTGSVPDEGDSGDDFDAAS